MPIKVNFADAFLQSYGPGAQQGAAQFQAMQRQKAQEQQFQIERADAMQRYEQENALKQGQLANQTAQNTREQATFDAEQADMRTAQQGAQSLAAGVPDPRQRIADIGGMFKSEGPRTAFIERETKSLVAQEKKDAAGKLSLMIREAKAKPQIAGDAVLAGQMAFAEQLANHPDADPIAILKEVDSVYKQAGTRQTGLKHLAEYQSRLQARIDKRRAIADALDEEGEYDRAQEIYDQIEQAESAFAPGEIEHEKSGESYNAALKILQPGRSKKEADGPLTYNKAYTQAEVNSADVKVMNENLRAAAYDEVFGRTGSEEEAEKAAKKVRGLTLSQMRDMEAKRLVSRDAQDRQGPSQNGQAQGQAQAPQQMNGAAQAPMQPQAQAQAMPPAEFTKRKPEEQQSFLAEIEADLRDGGGTNLEAIYQKYGVVPGSLPPAVKARLKRAASGG